MSRPRKSSSDTEQQPDSHRDTLHVVDELADHPAIMDEEFLWLTELLVEALAPDHGD